MHILALEEYGLRCLLQLALRDADGLVSAQEIARAEGIGPEYVARIMGMLRSGGLLQETLQRISPEDLRRDEPAMLSFLGLATVRHPNRAGEQRS
jgi:hypothetical protein